VWPFYITNHKGGRLQFLYTDLKAGGGLMLHRNTKAPSRESREGKLSLCTLGLGAMRRDTGAFWLLLSSVMCLIRGIVILGLGRGPWNGHRS
jgi:hypothetical protein